MLSNRLVGAYVDIERNAFGDDTLSGFVLNVSDELCLIHYVSSAFQVDGYCVIRQCDITACNVFDDSTCFTTRALRLKNVRLRKLKGVDIASWAAAIESAASQFPLLVLHREECRDDSCLVGHFKELNSSSVTFFSISPSATWDKTTQVLLAQLTRLDFGGGYEDALWKVASEDGRIPQ